MSTLILVTTEVENTRINYINYKNISNVQKCSLFFSMFVPNICYSLACDPKYIKRQYSCIYKWEILMRQEVDIC